MWRSCPFNSVQSGVCYVYFILATVWTITGSNPFRDKRVFSSSDRPDRLWGPPSPHGYRGSFPGVKRPGREADRSFAPGAEVKNEWGYICAPHHLPSWHGQGQVYFTFSRKGGPSK
jgi:hypothetical protein